MTRTTQHSQSRGPHGSLERRITGRPPPSAGSPSCVVAFGHRRHGRHEEHRPEHRRARRVGPRGPDPGRGLQAARRRERPDPEPLASAGTPAFDAAVEDVVARVSGRPSFGTSARRSLPATPTRSRRTGTRPSSSFEIRGDPTRQPTRIAPVLDAVAAAQAAHPRLLHRRVRRRKRGRRPSDDQYGKDLGRPGRSRSRSR